MTDKTDGSPDSWRWKFGDGETSTKQNPLHIYRSNGVYNVKLVVTNEHKSDTTIRENFILVSRQKWRFFCHDEIEKTSAAVGPDGTIYIGAFDGYLYAVKGMAPPADTPWPMYKYDPRHTGRQE